MKFVCAKLTRTHRILAFADILTQPRSTQEFYLRRVLVRSAGQALLPVSSLRPAAASEDAASAARRDRREMVFNNSVALQSVRPKHKVQAGEPDDVPAAGVAFAPAWQQEPVGTVQRVRHTMGLCPRILVTHLQQGDCNDIR